MTEEQEKEELKRLYKKAETVKESIRYHAVLLAKEGISIKEVSEICYIDEDTVRLWVKRWEQEKNVRDRERSGSPPKINKELEQEITKLVDENRPDEHGYKTFTWDCVELSHYIKEEHGIGITDEGIRKILKKNGFHYKKAEYLYTKRDIEEREHFIEEISFLYETKTENTIIMFGDEMSSKEHPKLPYVWTRDDKPIIATSCSHKRVSTIGAIEPLIGKKVIANYDKNNADSFIDFLSNIEKEIDENVILILDNYPVHHSRKVKDYLEKNDKINLIFLPTYSPDLNPIEWLWGYARKKYLNGFSPPDIDKLKEKLNIAFNSISPHTIMSICSLVTYKKYLST